MQMCDIIIPTYNCANVLPLTLRSLQNQRVPQGWSVRVIISDDGSEDDTVGTISNFQFPISNDWRAPLVLKGKHTGRAVARNRAIDASDADMLLFLGADIILRPGALAKHLVFHSTHPEEHDAALGMVRWDPRIRPSPFMEWMVHGGQQNAFDEVIGRVCVDPRHFFYGSHLSVKRSVFADTRFPTDYHIYGWEDVDIGRRLADEGLVLTVLHSAIGLHRHMCTVVGIYERQRTIGSAVRIYQRHYPTVHLAPLLTHTRRVKLLLFRFSGARFLVRWCLRLLSHWVSTPKLFLLATSAEFWYGYIHGARVRR